MPQTTAPVPSIKPVGFSTFGGVFTPCTLTILGVIMFLRFGQVVGNAGIGQALLIVAMAKLITTLTALSLSAIATNTRVKGGGAYFLISRSLGVEFGGAIGIVFYLSQAISVAMYVIGFTEALIATVPALADHSTAVASVVNLCVFVCVFIGAGWTIKMQYGILVILLIAIGAFVGGACQSWNTELLVANWSSGHSDNSSLWIMFALFFPAATGIMAGANMSGDLADPAKSIPRGTLGAILFTGLIYAGFALLLGASAERSILIGNTLVVSELSLSSSLIVAGIFCATLSSALGSLMGAPRILQALARDQVFKSLTPFAKGSGLSNEPRRATILSAIIAQAGIMLGDLNAIAPIITMFFMITYGALNFATFSEAFSGNPSYRPSFRWCHWSLSLLGALLCCGTMLLVDPMWAIAACLVMVGIYRWLNHQELESSWGDVASGTTLERARRNLLLLEQERYHPKNWRPNILAMGAGLEGRLFLAVWGRRLCGEHGLLMLGQVILGDEEGHLDRHARAVRLLRKTIQTNDLGAFPVAAISESLSSGMSALVQCAGIGALRPNLIFFGWSDKPENRQEFLTNLRTVARLGRSIAIMRQATQPEDPWVQPKGSIDVWWLGQGNGSLMLLLAHILRRNVGWRNREIRLIRMVENQAAVADVEQHLIKLAKETRIPATPRVIIGSNFIEALRSESQHSALVILGCPNAISINEEQLQSLEHISDGLPRVLFVNSAGDMSLDS